VNALVGFRAGPEMTSIAAILPANAETKGRLYQFDCPGWGMKVSGIADLQCKARVAAAVRVQRGHTQTTTFRKHPRKTGFFVVTVQARQIRLFIVDPQPLIAKALGHLFAVDEELNVVGSSQRVKALLLRTVCPDVILLGNEHGASDMVETIAVCKEAVPNSRLCVISCHTHPDLLQRVFDAGADGYTIKDVEPSELVRAIKTIAGGATYVDPRVGGYLLKTRSRGQNVRKLSALSYRELQIVKLIAEGMSNKEISSSLDLSEKTIKNHISRIFAKLQITGRTQVVAHAFKSGIA
jgi:DNA-binding NarL/FixJ family response regulator